MINIIIEKLCFIGILLEGITLQMTASDAAIVIIVIAVVAIYVGKDKNLFKSLKRR